METKTVYDAWREASADKTIRVERNEADVRSWQISEEHPDSWCRIGDGWAMEALEVLPPIYFRGGFAVSEAVTSDLTGAVMYLCVVTVHGTSDAYYCRVLSIKDATEQAPRLRASVAGGVP